MQLYVIPCSNNTNKLSPQELGMTCDMSGKGSNNTNKLSPQELILCFCWWVLGSNNTNKLSPQEQPPIHSVCLRVQIIQINLVLKNYLITVLFFPLFK